MNAEEVHVTCSERSGQSGLGGRSGQMDRSEKRTNAKGLISPHGGYRKLKSFQVAELVYDVTTRFCDKYISPRSRTYDQMV